MIYKMNEHNVCINANEYEIYQSKEGKVVIKTALINEKWRAGHSVMFGNFGCGGLPSPNDKPFDTERECIENDLKWIEKYLKDNDQKQDFEKIFKLKMSELFPIEKQLTLF